MCKESLEPDQVAKELYLCCSTSIASLKLREQQAQGQVSAVIPACIILVQQEAPLESS